MRMHRTLPLLLAGLVVLPAAPSGPGGTPKGQPTPTGPGLVEVRYADGSVVVMTLLQDKIEIQTDYGKLTVPPRDLRHIEFGIHTSEEEQRKLDDAFRRLSSKAFREREEAVHELVALGPRAYQRLQHAVKGEDQEAAKRAAAAVKQIQEKFHPRLLRPREDDVVRTAKFTIVGRITTPVIKAKAENFGDLELRPAKLLALRRLEGETRKEVVVDAAAYGGAGGRKWMETGVRVESQMGLKITATGQVDLWPQQPGQYMSGPDGQAAGLGAFLGGVNVRQGRIGGMGTGGELLGRIGENGTPFVVGSRHAQTPKEAGPLYLQIMQSPWGAGSAGEYRVTITTGAFTPDSGGDE